MKKIIILLLTLYSGLTFASETLHLENKNFSLNNNQPKYSVTVNYPVINDPQNVAEHRFNAVTREWVNAKIAEFKKSVSQNSSNSIPTQIKAKGSTLSITYDLATLEPHELVSLRFSSDSYIAGAAHGSHTYSVINYDLIHNKNISLASLFKPNANYLPYLSQIATKKLTLKLNKEGNGQQVPLFKEGLTPIPKNFEVWNITPQGLRLTFNEYQVAAYVFGPQEIILANQMIKPFLSVHSVLGNCLARNNCRVGVFSPR